VRVYGVPDEGVDAFDGGGQVLGGELQLSVVQALGEHVGVLGLRV
jgi:hypothetical protein